MQSQFLQTCTKERAESEVPKLAGTTPSGIPCANAAAAAMDTDGQALALQIPMQQWRATEPLKKKQKYEKRATDFFLLQASD